MPLITPTPDTSPTLASIFSEISSHPQTDRLPLIESLNSFLSSHDVKQDHDSITVAAEIESWLAACVRPVYTSSEYESNSPSQDKFAIYERGLQTTQPLQSYIRPQTSSKDHSIVLISKLVSWLSFTDLSDPWTTAQNHRAAASLLIFYQNVLKSQEFQTKVLADFIRPLFTASKPTTVTEQGRKDRNPVVRPAHESLGQMDEERKVWKTKEVWSLPVFGWVVENIETSFLQQSWHLIIPPLLTLLDDHNTTTRVRGLKLLSKLLPKVPAKTLAQTGLGEVFEDAIRPTLLFLPSLTPIDESMVLLPAAYDALFDLSNVRYPGKMMQGDKNKMQDRIMRQGILPGFQHCRDSIAIREILIAQLNRLVIQMELHAIKHLKDIIPILSDTISDPFCTAQPTLLLAAIRAVQTLILNCWPRLSENIHLMELVKAISLCWESTNEVGIDGTDLSIVRQELRNAVALLTATGEGRVDWAEQLEPLLCAEPSLREVFSGNEVK